MKIFHLPDLGEGLAEAEIREWYVNEGQEVKIDQPLVSMETAKAVVDVPSPYSGKIIKLHGVANEIIKTGAPLITFQTDEKGIQDQGSVVGKLETSEHKWDESEAVIGQATPRTQSPKAMPAARLLAKEMGVDLALVNATGPQGLITPDDVKRFLQQPPAARSDFQGQSEALHGVRRVMAQTMAQSHREVVPVTIIEDADISEVLPKTDITVKLIEAIIAAAKAEPSLNAWFDGQSMERKVFSEVNLGLAVDTPEGLFVPVIKAAETLSSETLRQKIDTYKVSVKNRSVAQKEMQGATITLSNFGMITGRYATPIIVPPAVAILGCGRSREVPLVRDGKVIIGKVLPLSLTFDHRAVTGGEATRFLGTVIQHLRQSL